MTITTGEEESSMFSPRKAAAAPSDSLDTSIKQLLENVFDETSHDGPMSLAFMRAEITSVCEFLSLDHDGINELECETSEGNLRKPSLMQCKKLKGAVAWGNNSPAGPTTQARWSSVTAEEALAATTLRHAASDDDAISTQSGQTSTVVQVNLVDSFRKSIKKDRKDFPDLTNDHKWETFKQKLFVSTQTQRVEDILDPVFLADDMEGQLLFEEKAKFMASVFEKVLQTTKSKMVLRKHRMTGDAQALYAELVRTYEDPLTKELTRKELKDKLEAHTIPSNWSKSLESWILSWNHKLQDLEDAMGAALPDGPKKTSFEDAIRSHEKLQPQIQQARVMQSTVARLTGATSADMGFNVFCEFVLNQAKEMDNAEAKTKVRKALKTRVNQHQQGSGKSGKGKDCKPPT